MGWKVCSSLFCYAYWLICSAELLSLLLTLATKLSACSPASHLMTTGLQCIRPQQRLWKSLRVGVLLQRTRKTASPVMVPLLAFSAEFLMEAVKPKQKIFWMSPKTRPFWRNSTPSDPLNILLALLQVCFYPFFQTHTLFLTLQPRSCHGLPCSLIV